MPRTEPTTGAMFADLTAMMAEPPRSVAKRIADVYVDDAEAGRVTTKDDLNRLGFTAADIEAHAGNASTIAAARLKKREDRDIHASPVKSLAEVERDIADIIVDNLPDTKFLIADCQARGISKQQLDLLFHRARARAALTFCHADPKGAH
ncbi:hypothetical protein [Devosia sp. Naph2]|uniref:hypothetical protein n=1 Tax=Devosia polycyclovorans TaxID=3345148 RepID=UPI0035D0C92B